MAPMTLDGNRFTFLGHSAVVGADWNDSTFPKLWIYNLHYLDNLNSIKSDQQDEINQNLVARWVEANPVMQGNGWEPYVISLRAVNLVKWFSRRSELQVGWLTSLATQAQALEKQLEYHILGNHLFANGKALVFVGAYLSGADADRWLAKGLKILDNEIAEQFLDDGAHFELSPMYHATLVWDISDLVHLAEVTQLPELVARAALWKGVVERGLAWLQGMVHPDGGIGFFNDAAFGIAPELDDIERYAHQVGCLPKPEVKANGSAGNGWALLQHPASGYVTIHEAHSQHLAILDLAKVGPDYQPGHAHADTLSFELSLFGQRVLVNSGTSQYGDDAERHRQRSTEAHNTVEVDGQNSSEVWGGFRVARRAYPSNKINDQQGGRVLVSASHTGYLRLPGKVTHHREWQFYPDTFQVKDTVSGDFTRALARLYCHPSVSVATLDANSLLLTLPGGQTLTVKVAGARALNVIDSTWHPRFGEIVKNQCVVVEFGGREVTTLFEWSNN
ncbi:MAG: alginate lyase family protein [Saccharospirillum sp.]|uniref:heparinase II/III family protein n=1 Tax=Saccharospirillum sp. TaxID=2033801 RepID=UPI00329822B1